jgi:hypothetical protein
VRKIARKRKYLIGSVTFQKLALCKKKDKNDLMARLTCTLKFHNASGNQLQNASIRFESLKPNEQKHSKTLFCFLGPVLYVLNVI